MACKSIAVTFFIILSISMISNDVCAANEQEIQEEIIPQKNNRFLVREKVGGSYLSAVSFIDNFFSGKKIESEQNKSYLKLETQATIFERSDNDTDFRLRGKIDLPNTQDRLRFFFDSDLRENNSLESQNRAVSSGDRIVEKESFAGVEYANKKSQSKWKRSAHIGVKTQTPISLFFRYRFKRKWQMNPNWASYFRQDIWYLDGVGWGETTRLEFQGKLSEKFTFLTLSEIKYRDEPQPLEYIHEWIVSQRVSDRFGIDYKLGHLREDNDSNNFNGFNRHFLNITFRKQIYSDWLFFSVTPEALIIRDDIWKSDKSLTFKLELFLTD